jgi:hypothetical protein
MAVGIRVTVLKLLLKTGRLDPKRQEADGTVPDKILELFARCSLVRRGEPGKGQIEFDFKAILKALEER